MGVLKVLLNMKSTIKAENAALPKTTPPSPAVSSISSYGSGTLLIHGQHPKGLQKRKTFFQFGRKKVPAKLMNIIWSGLFLMVIIATVIVVVALAENIRRTLWMKEDESSVLQPISNFLEDTFSKIRSDVGEKTCVHRRFVWEHRSRNSEIIHDLGAKWSAVVDHDEARCLIFDMHNTHTNGCPLTYPWDMDIQVGIPACRGPLAEIAPIRKIMHHICINPQVNLTNAGKIISRMCADYKLLIVDKVIIHYFDHHFRRVARRSIATAKEKSMKNIRALLHGQYLGSDDEPHKAKTLPVDGNVVLNEHNQTARLVFTSEKRNQHSLTKRVTDPDKVSAPKFEAGEHPARRAPENAAKESSIHLHNVPKARQKPTVGPSRLTKKPHLADDVIPIVIEMAYPKRARKLNNDVKKELEDDRLSKGSGDEKTGKAYWEVIYNYVEAADNIHQARTFKELILGTQGNLNGELDDNIML